MKTKLIYVVRLNEDVAIYHNKPVRVEKRRIPAIYGEGSYVSYTVVMPHVKMQAVDYLCYSGFRRLTGIAMKSGQVVAIRPASVRFVSAKNGKPPRTGRSAR